MPSNQSSHQGHEHDSGIGANPYYANQQHAVAPDLDANAPLLKSNDMQRLNRKALVFLAGIIGLLALMAVLTFKNATSGHENSGRPREETVVIPELPRDAVANSGAGRNDAEPIQIARISSSSVEDDLPPLPVIRAPQPLPPLPETTLQPQQPTLLERRMNAAEAASKEIGTSAPQDPYLQAMLAGLPGGQANTAGNQRAPAHVEATSAQFINNPDALLVRGAYIRCVLETRIITDIPGFTSCIVTEPVYSINGRRLLLPKGSKMSGKYSADATGPRVSVVWDRVTTPNGIDVIMASPGVDNLGGAGHPGDYNAHWAGRMGSALFISLISDAFKYAAAEHGPTTTTISNGIITQAPFESNTARTMERLANQALTRSANRPATVTINQGAVVNVYVAKDVDFSGVLAR